RDDDVLRLVALAVHLDAVRRGDPARALQPVDLVLPEEELDALDVGLDHLVLVGEHGLQVELDLADLDPEAGERVLRLLELLAGLQERLGGNAADVEAGAAERRALFHAGDLEPELRRADRADVAAGPGADHDEVVSRLGHSLSSVLGGGAVSRGPCHRSSSRRSGSSMASLTLTRKVTASRPSTMRWS